MIHCNNSMSIESFNKNFSRRQAHGFQQVLHVSVIKLPVFLICFISSKTLEFIASICHSDKA